MTPLKSWGLSFQGVAAQEIRPRKSCGVMGWWSRGESNPPSRRSGGRCRYRFRRSGCSLASPWGDSRPPKGARMLSMLAVAPLTLVRGGILPPRKNTPLRDVVSIPPGNHGLSGRLVEPGGIEPPSRPREGRIFPLDHGPMGVNSSVRSSALQSAGCEKHSVV